MAYRDVTQTGKDRDLRSAKAPAERAMPGNEAGPEARRAGHPAEDHYTL